MSTFVLCVGCGKPIYGVSPCRWCTCERCGIDLLNGICPLCNSSNSCTYDHNPNSFDYPPDSYHPPHPTYETYSGDTCRNDSHFGYDCPPRFSLNYEVEPGYIQNYNSYPHDSPSLPQQYPCCEDCEHGDEHLDTILATESNEFIKSSVENLVPNPSESDGENEPSEKDLFEPSFDEEIIPMKIDPYSFNAESDLIESMPNHDSSIIISSKIDSLFDEFAGELTLLKSIPSGIDETDCHPEEETHFTKRLLYDNPSPRPPEECVSESSNIDIESFYPSPILIKDSDSHMEEIDLSFNPDDPMPPGIEEDDDDSERDIPILEKLLDNYSLSLPEIESFHFDIPSSYRPPAKPPDGNTKILNIKMMGDISHQKGLEAFQSSAECPMMINGKNTPILDVPLFYFYPLDHLKYGGN
nr:pre-mRNA splicing Prp18-interacting factor [Tanacetum cinerariifolium]